MGRNSRSKQKSKWKQLNEKYPVPKVDFSGDAATVAAVQAREKQEKDKLVAATKANIKPAANPNKKAGASNQPCLLQSNPPHPYASTQKDTTEEKKKTCSLSGLTVDKSGRGYVLNVTADKNKFVMGKLDIIAGYNKKSAEVSANITGLSGPCDETHKTKVIDFTEKSISKTVSALKFDAFSKFAFNFFPKNPATNKYWIAANTCGATVGTEITVYPDTYWKVKFKTEISDGELDDVIIEGEFKEDQNNLKFNASLKKGVDVSFSNDSSKMAFKQGEGDTKAAYSSDTTKIGFASTADRVESNYENTTTNTKSHTSFSKSAAASNDEPGDENALEGEAIGDMSLEYGNIKWKVNKEVQSKINNLFKAIKTVDFIKDIIDKIFKESESPVDFDIMWPCLEINGEWQWKEIPGSPKCGFEYAINGGLHPLVGCGVDVDLIGSALLAIPVYGNIASKCLSVMEYITGNKISMNFKLEGQVDVDFDISKKAADKKAEISDPSTHADINLELSAKLKLKKENYYFSYGGGVQGSAKIVIGIHKPVVNDESIKLPCDFTFSGVTFEKVTFAKATSEFSDSLPDEDPEVEEVKTEMVKDWLKSETHPFNIPII